MIYHVQFPALGLEFTVNRVAFSIFGLNIYWYGVIITLGIVLCVMLGLKLGKYYKLNEDDFIDVIMVSAFLGIVCARVYYVIFAPFKYESLLDMINIRDGGLAIYGGIIGGFLFGYLACKWKKFDFLTVADIAANLLPFGAGYRQMGQFCKSRGLRHKYNFNFRYDKRGHNRVFAKRKRKIGVTRHYR